MKNPPWAWIMVVGRVVADTLNAPLRPLQSSFQRARDGLSDVFKAVAA
jgi:hypothetical protein